MARNAEAKQLCCCLISKFMDVLKEHPSLLAFAGPGGPRNSALGMRIVSTQRITDAYEMSTDGSRTFRIPTLFLGLMRFVYFMRRTARLLHGCSAVGPVSSLVRNTNRPFAHQRRNTKRPATNTATTHVELGRVYDL